MTNKKCVVLFSGGLDSKLALKIMQQRGFEIVAIFLKLPFLKDNLIEIKEFLKNEKIKLKILNCTKGKLLQEYLEIIRRAEHGRGKGINPCIDCRIFMLKQTKKFADKNKINFIVTGEVTGQRPFSQYKKQMNLIEKEANLNGRIIRPLIDYENISGRTRKKQINLAKKFKIDSFSFGGGCLLCEKILKNRLKTLLERGLNEKEVKFIGIGRHFIIDYFWIIIGRNKEENEIIEKSKAGKVLKLKFPAPSAIITGKYNKEIIEKINELIRAYSKQGSLKDRKKFEKYKL